MKGSHRIIVESRKVKYDFVIHRNITIITGDSGSGKTVLIDLIHDYGRYGADSGVFLSCDCPCKVIDSEDWERKIEETTGSIIFIDEGNRFLVSKKFAQLVQGSDNYFVLATREKLPALPYSVSEIYGFRKSGKFHDAKQKYNEIYHLYGEISEEKNINPKLVITEDSNSGFEFFNEMSRQKGVNCFSAGGKSNIIRQLEQSQNEEGTILVIVDGAAFGSEMKDISECIKTQGNIVLYAPESFEWLLLSTKEIPEVNVETVLQNPEEYIDSKEYVSWERYFTDLLIESTSKNFIWAYSKKRLTKAYFAPRIVNAVKAIMKLVDWEKDK